MARWTGWLVNAAIVVGVGLLVFGLVQWTGAESSGFGGTRAAGWPYNAKIEIGIGSALLTAGVLGMRSQSR